MCTSVSVKRVCVCVCVCVCVRACVSACVIRCDVVGVCMGEHNVSVSSVCVCVCVSAYYALPRGRVRV